MLHANRSIAIGAQLRQKCLAERLLGLQLRNVASLSFSIDKVIWDAKAIGQFGVPHLTE